jgi:hypothetical protein
MTGEGCRWVGRCLSQQKLEWEKGAHTRDALQEALKACAPGSIGQQRRKEAETLHPEGSEPSVGGGRSQYPTPHAYQPTVPFPSHARGDEDLGVVKKIVGIGLEERDAATWAEQADHRGKRPAKIVKMMEDEETHHQIEPPPQAGRGLFQVGTGERDVETSAIVSTQSVKEYTG